MEVDLSPSSPSPSSSSNNGSSRSSPFAFVASGSSGPSFASMTGTLTAEAGASGPAWTSSSRKRRRSSGNGGDGVSSSSNNLPCGFLHYQEAEVTASENRYEHRSKRPVPRSGLTATSTGDEQHYFRSLGSAYETEGMGGFESEYEVDSPMQTLTLASLNGSPESQNGIEDDAASAGSFREEDDIEMVHGGLGVSEDLRTSSAPVAPTFIPRQVARNLRTSHIPVRPSPLARSNVLESGNSSPSSDSVSNQQRRSPSSSPGRNGAGSPASSAGAGETSRKLTQMSIPARTPSPSPNDAATRDRSSSQLNPSPGLGQREFPGAKQMLKYTMGFRDDCSLCRSRTPGHYGHLVSRN